MDRQAVKRRPIAEMSSDRRILYNVIESHMVKGGEDFISYADLSKAIGGRDVQGEARGLLIGARKDVERDHGLLIEVVASEGLKRTKEVNGVLERQIRHVGRTTRRQIRRAVNAMSTNGITNDEKILVNTNLSRLGVIEQFTHPKAAKAIEAKVRANEAKELPFAETLRMFES